MNASFGVRPSTPPVVKILVGINIAMYLLSIAAEAFDIQGFFEQLVLFNWLSPLFRPWQLLTSIFLHSTSSFTHIFFNMLALWMFGSSLENHWGSRRFLMFYLVCGVGASIIHNSVEAWQMQQMFVDANAFFSAPGYTSFEYFVSNYLPGSFTDDQINSFLTAWYNDRLNPGYTAQAVDLVESIVEIRTNSPTVGASGAVYGLLLAFGMTFPNAMILMLIPPIPMRAKYLVLIYGLLELSMGLRDNLDDNIAHFAHLGGMFFGLLLILWFRKQDRNRHVF